MILFLLVYQIDSSTMKRMTLPNTYDRSVSSLQCTETFESFESVFGTSWIKSAGPRFQWADGFLIKFNQSDKNIFHDNQFLCRGRSVHITAFQTSIFNV